MLDSLKNNTISAFGGCSAQSGSPISWVQVEIIAGKMARMENVVDKMAITLTDVVQASIDTRASTFVKTQDLRREVDEIKNENPDVPAWRNLQLTLSNQGDDMLARITAANGLLHER
eukprot:11044931-Karenia_brevis.AAC.1